MNQELTIKHVSGRLQLAGIPEFPRLTPENPAVSVFTDFTRNAVYSTESEATIDRALEFMKAVGVRFLFVKDEQDALVGLVTSNDILGEKPMRYLQSLDCTLSTCSREDVLVRHVMVPQHEWEVIDYADVLKAKISQVVDAFKSRGRRHLVVTEDCEGEGVVRGIFSATRVEQVLGIRIETVRTPQSFAEIESAVIHAG